MPIYEHKCRACSLDWLEEYSIYGDPPDICPECRSHDVYRCVTDSGVVHFKGGGWSPTGYSHNAPLEQLGKQVKVYDRKEDYERETVGEERLRAKKKLLKQNEAIKRTLGPDATITQDEADKKIFEAGEKKRRA